MKFPPWLTRRWLIAGGVIFGGLLLLAIGLGVIYPRVGAWMIKEKVGGRLAKKLGRNVTFGDIDVSLGHAVLRDVEVRGPLDGDMPLVHLDRVDVEFDTLASFVGSVKIGDAKITGMMITVRRDKFGRDNVRDILERVEDSKKTDKKSSTLGSYRPKKLTVTGVKVLADDAMTGTTATIDGGDATWTKEQLVARIADASATTPGAPKAAVESVDIRKMSGMPPRVTIAGGDISLWPKMSLSGIGGTIVADPTKPGHYVLELDGGYGGAPAKLWTARGGFDPKEGRASVDLVAAKFQLERIAPILARSAIVDYQSTSVDAELHVAIAPEGASFSGDLNLTGLNVGHPMIADKEVHDVDMSAKVAGSYTTATRTIALTTGDFVIRDVPFSVTGTIIRPRRDLVIPEAQVIDPEKPAVPMRGPYGMQVLDVRLVIPAIGCQRVIDAIPREMAPYMQGYKLKGMFDTDVKLAVDWTNLDALALTGHVGINHCKVVDEPDDSPKRLENPFEHYVEYEKGEWMNFIVGPENPDFVPIDQISPNLIKSIMTTEDGAFYKHHGFITSEFRTALISDLKSRRFRHGASSITMQMVKNVLLYREKTLARKLQELFLTWHVENTLTKDRILEIYFNVIEYGPALYGIGPAARHYFGKSAKDLNLVETAFFSSILPGPKDRYRQYCQNELFKWTQAKIDRILALMLKRERITQEEYDKAIATPLVFVKDPANTETPEECLKRVKKAIENSRTTVPATNDPDAPPAKSGKKDKQRADMMNLDPRRNPDDRDKVRSEIEKRNAESEKHQRDDGRRDTRDKRVPDKSGLDSL